MRFGDEDGAHGQDGLSRRNANTIDRSSYVPARILWPALGFPAVIAPGGKEHADSAQRICLLVLCDRDPKRRPLSKADVARHLRIVPWADRHKRFLPTREKGGTNAFIEEEIEVHKPKEIGGKDNLTELWSFASDIDAAEGIDDGENGIRVGLAKFVRQFYAKQGLKYLYEVRVSQEASAGVGTGLHHLFWINPDSTHDESKRSAEMDTLLEAYAKPTWAANLRKPRLEDLSGKTLEHWSQQYGKVLQEYEYDFRQAPGADTRTEVLHPVFVRETMPRLCISHVTDLHVDIRFDAYEANLRKAGLPAASKFYNWNRACERVYRQAKRNCDVLLMTGDLIDYGRGYNEIGELGENSSYWRDRDWFYFYELIAGGTKYAKPIYTILGNHDWRINPYPPFAPGAPSSDQMKINDDDLRAAHGANYDAGKAYDPLDGRQWAQGFIKKLFVRDGSLEIPGTPIETRVESVAWYLLLINPFLDYSAPLPGGYSLTMLDWAENEIVDQHVFAGGIDYGPTILIPNTAGQMAKDAITPNQMWLVQQVLETHIGPKILGIHAPLVGPWPHWPNDQLAKGRIKFEPADMAALYKMSVDDEKIWQERLKYARGATVNTRTTYDKDGKEIRTERIWEHPTLAFRFTDNDPAGQEADYGVVARQRKELIKLLQKAKFQLVFSGHIHRSNLLVVGEASMKDEEALGYVGGLMVKDVTPDVAKQAPGPLFVNTTSAGPPGNDYRARGVYRAAQSGYTEACLTKDGKLETVGFKAAEKVYEYAPVIR
jgi:hypothetical protein